MKFKLLIRAGLLSVLLSNLLPAFAESQAVPCPTVDLVKQASQLLDDALADNWPTYIVSTSQTAFNFGDKPWVVRTTVPAQNDADAIKLAQLIVHDARALLTPNALPVRNGYGCAYYSDRAFVYAFSGLAADNRDFTLNSH